jgi:hypothetical protein
MSFKPICIERELIQSQAFLSLKTPSAYRVFMIFYLKRQMEKRGVRGKKERWICVNNGSLIFTFGEAKKYGMSSGKFSRAIDDLREKGFLDITESGSGLHKFENKYALSERWRKYGTPDYQAPEPRPQGPINKGFRKGNRYGKNCREKIETTVTDNKPSIVVYEHGQA